MSHLVGNPEDRFSGAAAQLLLTFSVSCPSGDTAGVVKSGMTCTELIDAKNYECYDSVIETQCCESCNNLTLTLTGTSAGKPFLRYLISDTQGLQLCLGFPVQAVINDVSAP